MKAIYTLTVKSDIKMPVPEDIKDLLFENTLINWKINENRYLEEILIELSGMQIPYSETGMIMSTSPEIEEKAYYIANYLANRIFIQTGYDPIEPSQILSNDPLLFSETPPEKLEYKTKPKLVGVELKYSWVIHNLFQPDIYTSSLEHSKAYGYYADALRVISDFQKFELFYKVVEYFFPNFKGENLDKAVSSYTASYTPVFSQDVVEQLRILRNRIIHPDARKGHLHPGKSTDIKIVREKLGALKELAKLLLDNPRH